MGTIKVIEERRSIRNFKNQSVPKEIIEDIINCGRLAPSAKNRQPWFFVVIQNEIKNKIADMMIEYTLNHDENLERKNLGNKGSVNPTANVIKQAPILILIFKEYNDNWLIGDNLSIGACVENMCLRATDLGLGSLWIRDTVYVQKEIAKLVGYEDLELNCTLALGYPNEAPKMRPRKKLEDIIDWI